MYVERGGGVSRPYPRRKAKPSGQRKSMLIAMLSCSRRKWNHVGLFHRTCRERDALCLRNAVFAAQVTIGFHCQRPAVFVSEPTRDGRNVHAAFDAARCKQMPQVVMGDTISADLLARSIKRLLAFADAKYFVSNDSPGRSLRTRSNNARASGISGTRRTVQFFVAVSGSPRTTISPASRSTSRHVI